MSKLDRKVVQANRARQSWRFKLTQIVRKSAHFSKAQFLIALMGTGGVIKDIAKGLDTSSERVRILLDRPDWDDVREAWLEEMRAMKDHAICALRDAMIQRLDVATAARTAQWYLSKVEREQFGDKVNEGEPIRVQHAHLHATVSVDALDLPLDVRRKILEAAEAKEQEAIVVRQKQERAIRRLA